MTIYDDKVIQAWCPDTIVKDSDPSPINVYRDVVVDFQCTSNRYTL